MVKRRIAIGILLVVALALLLFGLHLKKAKEKPKAEPIFDEVVVEEEEIQPKDDRKIDCEDVFFNAARGYQVPLLSRYEIYESAGFIYFRNSDTKSQITLIYTPETFTDGIALWENASIYMDKMRGMVWNESGEGTEKSLKLYGAGPKTTATIGDYSVQSEKSELWFRNTGEAVNVKVEAYGYYTVFNGHGLILLGYTQGDASDVVLNDMKGLLEGLKPYEPKEEQMEMAEYHSAYTDGTSFNYPSDWKLTDDGSGMVLIKAPQTQTSAYAGMQIVFISDASGRFASDPAQFSSYAEADILRQTFMQPVGPYDFNYTSVVTKMDDTAKIGQKDAIYYEIEDTLYPDEKDVRSAVGYSGLKVESVRLAYSVGKTPCMLNFVCPNEASKELAKEMIESVMAN